MNLETNSILKRYWIDYVINVEFDMWEKLIVGNTRI